MRKPLQQGARAHQPELFQAPFAERSPAVGPPLPSPRDASAHLPALVWAPRRDTRKVERFRTIVIELRPVGLAEWRADLPQHGRTGGFRARPAWDEAHALPGDEPSQCFCRAALPPGRAST